jgi:hypothetical protein
MRRFSILSVLTAAVCVLAILAPSGGGPVFSQEGQKDSAVEAGAGKDWKYPIAPGVWYPGETLPEHPVRYYRARCWPGCHRGSEHGMYPDTVLPMKPIFPTSTVTNYVPAAKAKE